ncbi:MAG: glycosyltransferase family 2 protein, partial [Candidatus Kryptoniota bacterium]
LDRVTSFLSSHPYQWEIVVVESGSMDNTLNIIREVANNNPKIKIIHQEHREGMGSALRAGYAQCSCDLIWHVESDSPFDTNNLISALPLLQAADFVAGYRIGKRESFMRWLYSFVYNRLVRLLFRLRVTDVNFSFKVFKRANLEKIKLRSSGWFIDAELLIETKKHGFKIAELGIPYNQRIAGSSTVSIFTPLPILKEMFIYRIKYFHSS